MQQRLQRTAGRRLRFENLENRRLLAAEIASGLSLDAVRDQIAGQFSAATIVTHGFQIDGAGDSLMSLAEAIVERNGGLLVDIDAGPVDGATTFDIFESESRSGAELVFLFDWGDASNNDSAGWGEAAGDALFSIGAELGLFDPDAGLANAIDLHFIAHSFGTAITSEAIERLAAFDVPVDQVTYLDPHDFDQARLPVDGSQRLFDLGLPQIVGSDGSGSDGYGATVWDNVAFADAYYQTNSLGFIPINPGGRPIPGAYNVSVTEATEDFFIPHSAVWSDFYLDTITDLSSTTGYAFSSRVIDGPDRPAAVFFGAGQEHDHTPNALVNRSTGDPNPTGLASLGLTDDEITNARFEPVWSPDIVNGDFDFIGNASDEVPGWVFHGGGGDAGFQAGVDGALRLIEAGQSRTHNFVYLPTNTSELQFELAFDDSDTDATIEVLVGGTLVESLTLSSLTPLEQTLATTSGITRTIPIESLGGRTRAITFRLASAAARTNIRIDDLTFTRSNRSFDSDHRTIVVDSVAGQQSIPVDTNTIAIQFIADSNATIQIESTDDSIPWTSVFVVDEQFVSIGSVDGMSLSADITEGRSYAVLFDPTVVNRFYTITSSAGDDSLNRLAPTNLFSPTDVNADGRVSALDALIIINALISSSDDGSAIKTDRPFLDVNDDDNISAADALRVINVLNDTVPRSNVQAEPILVGVDSLTTEEDRRWDGVSTLMS